LFPLATPTVTSQPTTAEEVAVTTGTTDFVVYTNKTQIGEIYILVSA